LRKSIEYTREYFTAEIKDLQTSQAEIKKAITKMHNQLDAMTTRMEEAEKRNQSYRR